MGEILWAFSTDEQEEVEQQLRLLAVLLQLVPGGGKLEEDHWASIYRRAKGIDRPGSWSNLPFQDFVEDGVGIEWKLLKRRSPSGDQGKSLMHPSATRVIDYDPALSAEACKNAVLEQWTTLIEQFRSRVQQTSPHGLAADLRWGILLWAPDLSEFLYFEEKVEAPNPGDYYAEWVESTQRGRSTRNLHIFEYSTERKRYSVTLPRNGAKIQPYFDVPRVSDGAYLFHPRASEHRAIIVSRETFEHLSSLARTTGKTVEQFVSSLARDATPAS